MAGKVVKQLAGSGTGQSLSDMMTAVKHTLSGSLVAKIICKATTEEMMPPKRKHLAYLVQCTFEPRLSIPDFANYLVSRAQHSNLVVVFKAFITIHHLMQYGHERFSQYIASNNCHFYLPSFSDRTSSLAHGILAFVRPYAKYLDGKAASYREIAFDLCRVKLGKEDSGIRTMPQTKLFKTIPVIEKQLDTLMAFDATSNELVNSVLRVAHLHLYRDLIRLYAVYNEAMINLIGRYFSMSKRDCKLSLNIYKSFVKRMDSMNTFVKIAESCDTALSQPLGADCITFQPVPSSVLEALEQHLVNLEGQKGSDSQAPTSQSSNKLSANKSSSSSGTFDSAHTVCDDQITGDPITSSPFALTEAERQRIIEEERARLESFVSSARKQAISNTEAEMRTTESQLQRLCTDADFVDLLNASDSESVVPTSSSLSVWSTTDAQPSSAGNTSKAWCTDQLVQPATGTKDLTLLDPFAIVQDKTTPPASTTAHPPIASASSSNPFVQNVPFVNQPLVSNGLLPTFNMWNCRPSQYAPFGLPTHSATSSSNPTSEAIQASDFQTNPLDARLAQLAGNLSIGSDIKAPKDVYRAPDGTMTAVNWTGFGAPSSQTGPIRNSASLNQLTGPTVPPAARSTNPWAYNGLPTFTTPFVAPTGPWNSAIGLTAGFTPQTSASLSSATFLSASAGCATRPTNPFL
ncbi:unnamed protein product [Dicrocoelium dendriticum]|nr:unnamed protein product [Dicrocoelium dendriticum]